MERTHDVSQYGLLSLIESLLHPPFPTARSVRCVGADSEENSGSGAAEQHGSPGKLAQGWTVASNPICKADSPTRRFSNRSCGAYWSADGFWLRQFSWFWLAIVYFFDARIPAKAAVRISTEQTSSLQDAERYHTRASRMEGQHHQDGVQFPNWTCCRFASQRRLGYLYGLQFVPTKHRWKWHCIYGSFNRMLRGCELLQCWAFGGDHRIQLGKSYCASWICCCSKCCFGVHRVCAPLGLWPVQRWVWRQHTSRVQRAFQRKSFFQRKETRSSSGSFHGLHHLAPEYNPEPWMEEAARAPEPFDGGQRVMAELGSWRLLRRNDGDAKTLAIHCHFAESAPEQLAPHCWGVPHPARHPVRRRSDLWSGPLLGATAVVKVRSLDHKWAIRRHRETSTVQLHGNIQCLFRLKIQSATDAACHVAKLHFSTGARAENQYWTVLNVRMRQSVCVPVAFHGFVLSQFV